MEMYFVQGMETYTRPQTYPSNSLAITEQDITQLGSMGSEVELAHIL